MIPALERLLEDDTAGDPMSQLKWAHKTPQKLSLALRALALEVCSNTVARLLKDLHYALRVNGKRLALHAAHPDRNQQFEHIKSQRHAFAARGCPIISVDAKKKELVGPFKNAGACWRKFRKLVSDHDFRSDALGIGTPYGVFDPEANDGYVVVGTSHDTPAFATDAIALWWEEFGQVRYRGKRELLILADGGGSNGARPRAFKVGLMQKLCDRYGLAITICHYPPGTSKWNPIEHRLFSEISKNWAGVPLESFQLMLQYIGSTTTQAGLRVHPRFLPRDYPVGVSPTKQQFDALKLAYTPGAVLPAWNYTLRPSV